MLFTPLHRELGSSPGPLTNDMLDAAVAAGVAETDDLDWKRTFPAAKDLAGSDVPKDIAAMANRGGGIIVYGVAETEKKADGRVDVGELNENYERAYNKVAINCIHPPVFGLTLHKLGDSTPRALAVVVPPSLDAPHLVYRNDYFGAPIRNNADTEWMREPQLERLYRTRLDDRRNAGQRLDQDYHHERQRRSHDRVWIIGVARPRIAPPTIAPMEQATANLLFAEASTFSRIRLKDPHTHPLGQVANFPKPGLRRWVAPAYHGDHDTWREAWASVCFDGAVSLASALGGMPAAKGDDSPNSTVNSRQIEWFVADLLALIKQAGDAAGLTEYELRVGLEPVDDEPVTVVVTDYHGRPDEETLHIRHFIPVEATIRTDATAEDYFAQIQQVALDVLNQAGIHQLRALTPPPSPS